MTRPPPRAFLEDLYARHHRPENLHPDPLVFARGFADPGDGELAGLVAAGLAYGQVAQIMATLGGVFQSLGPRPRATLTAWSAADLRDAFRGFRYRFHRGPDLALFLHLVRQALERYGSLGELFRASDPGGPVGPALAAFSEGLFAGDARPLLPTREVPPGHPARNLLPSPARGGAAKRLCLFLRWMVRSDALDPGYWHGRVDPARLVVPLDTHVARVGRELGFTARQAADWKTAGEITAALRRYDPADPVRYDFSLFRFGMGRGPRAPRG
ncbi:MAG: TIGR02757 family protein [Deferrisomatales bacterium]